MKTKTFVFIFLLFFSGAINRALCQNYSKAIGDREALMDLYNSTGGDYWTNNSGWGQGEPSDSWHGIEVDANGQVTRIDLFSNNLTGSLPAELGHLKQVEYLNVKGNNLTGQLPSQIANMDALRVLILSGRTYDIGGTLKEPPMDKLVYSYHPGKYSSSSNRFSGAIPAWLGELSNLEFLEFSDQPDVTGPIPPELGNLSNLKGLYLNMLPLEGYSIPASFSNLTELRHFYISSSGVVGQLPELNGMTHLTILQVVSNDTRGEGLTGELPDMSSLTNLRSVVLSKNELEGPFPQYFANGNFEYMHTLRLSWNNITGELPSSFAGMPYLKSLGLEGNSMTGSIAPLTTVPSNIIIIGAGWNNFSGDFPTGWPDFSQVRTIYLGDNNLTGSIPCSFWENIDNPDLNTVWVTGTNNFDDTCPSGEDALVGNGSVNE